MAAPEAPRGAFQGGVHVFPVRVYYEDTDAGGIVYHAAYLRYAERARTEMLRILGVDHGRLRRDHDASIVVRRLEAEFEGPARLDDLVGVETAAEGFTGARIRLRQHVRNQNMILVRLHLELGCVGGGGRARRWPAPVAAAFGRIAHGRRAA